MTVAEVTPDPLLANDERVRRLNNASLRRVIEPDADMPGAVGPGAVLPRELLSVAGVELDGRPIELTDEQWATLSREELASILDNGIRFEAVLIAGFGLMVAWSRNLTDPRTHYALHEIGEETRHSRMFARVVEQLAPTAKNPLANPVLRALDRFLMPRVVTRKALFCVMVLTGEEAPDLLQKRTSEHPDTDPFVREVNRYHRQEEARHLAFGRMLLGEVWHDAGPIERMVVRRIAPSIMGSMFDGLVHPGVYETVGLPGWKTWKAVRTSEARRAMKAEAFRPVLATLQNVGAFGASGRVPKAWQKACRVDASGTPLS